MSISTESFRVTSIPYRGVGFVVFAGVPLEKSSYKIHSGKYIVSVRVNPNDLPVQPEIGQHWIIKGAYVIKEIEVGDYLLKDHSYDTPQVECTLPESGEAFVRFIANQKDFKGIGELKARELWHTFKSKLYALLDEDLPEHREQLASVLREKSINSLYIGYEKYSNLKAANWLSKKGIPNNVQQRLFKHHNQSSIEAIKSDAYRLLAFGMSFCDVDKMAKEKFLILPTDQRRLVAATEAAMKKEVARGHTCISKPVLRKQIHSILDNSELTKFALKISVDKARFIYNSETETYHPSAQLLMESVVAKRLTSLSLINGLYDERVNQAFATAKSELPYTLTQKQCDAVMKALDNNVSCITGGAGTGKTTVLRTALRAFHRLGYTIHALALSGRAAMRLHESIDFETKTIARFLRSGNVINDRQLIVIDEASMIDLPLMYRIVTHIAPHIRILFVGDPDQLPPIGAGKILADIVESGVIINTVLDIVKRQRGSTGIPEYSRLINLGIVPDELSTGAITFHEANTKADIIVTCRDLYAQSPNNSRVMAPTKDLVKHINADIQCLINGDAKCMEFTIGSDEFYLPLRVGDEILFTNLHSAPHLRISRI